MHGDAARPEELVDGGFHAEHAGGEGAVDVVVAGDDAARAHLRVPRSEVLEDGVVIVTRVDVDEVEARVGDVARSLDRRGAHDLAACSVPGEAPPRLLVEALVLVLGHVRAIDVLVGLGLEPRVDRGELAAAPVLEQEVRVLAGLDADLGGLADEAAAVEHLRDLVTRRDSRQSRRIARAVPAVGRPTVVTPVRSG